MKVIILAGGLGTRLVEETQVKPKPMVEIGGYPIIWHIMKIYSHYGYNEFITTLGYKGEIIKDFFLNYKKFFLNQTINLAENSVSHHNKIQEDWIVHLLSTGANSLTGTRIRMAMEFAGKETVMMTYGDGLANVNVRKLYEFHKSHGKLATLTAVRPSARFGEINFDEDKVIMFKEKPQAGEGWINGGFFVLEPEVVNFLKDFDGPFEKDPLESLCNQGQLMAYKHKGFWQSMDVLRDKIILNNMWESNKAEWKVW